MKENGRANAAYVRVSSDKQDTARQVKRIEARGLPIGFWFRDETGKNPRDLAHKREAFQAMMKAVQAGLIGRIIVDRQDRFGVKDAYQWGQFISLLREHGATLEDADGKVLSADDDVSILTGTLGAITSTREQKEKAHRNITGKVSKAREGEYQGGYPPYAFDVVCFGADGKEKWRTVYVGHYKRWRVWRDGKREQFDGKDNSPRKDPTDKLFIRPTIEKDRIKVAGQIFGWYADEDLSPRQIATRLIELGVDPIYGRHWDKVRVREMLGNPAYIGYPTWNKHGASRFVEYVDGQFREVTDKKAGRHRAESDYVKPAKPLYKPLVPPKTWEKVQAKLRVSSEKSRSVAKHAPDTADLYLRPFVICGHCGKPMHATMGRTTAYLWPSYFCSTYNRLGPRNPVGCHCHRVRHSVLENVVKSYLAETAPQVAQLLEATNSGNLEAARPLLESLAATEKQYRNTTFDIVGFIDKYGDVPQNEVPEENEASLAEVYGLLYERFRPGAEAAIAQKEAALDKMLDEFRGLSPKMKQRLNQKMEALQGEIDALHKQLTDLREPWGNLQQDLIDRQAAYDRAVKILSKEGAGRQKAEALRAVISQVVCWFRHTVEKSRKRPTKTGKDHNGKSFLDRVQIVPITGEKRDFTIVINGNTPGPG